jgi:hypothetical protein
MAQVITFEDYQPTPRYDSTPWTNVQVEESAAATGPWTLIDTLAITPVDADPAYPASRSFTTELASDTVGLWYRLIFLDGSGDDALPTTAVQNVSDFTMYARTSELAQILKVSEVQRGPALRRVIQAATFEIDSEIGATDILGTTLPYQSPPPLVVEVCLERAVEHWQQEQSPFGIIGLGSELGPTFTGRDSWSRHAFKLAPLKGEWGLA